MVVKEILVIPSMEAEINNMGAREGRGMDVTHFEISNERRVVGWLA